MPVSRSSRKLEAKSKWICGNSNSSPRICLFSGQKFKGHKNSAGIHLCTLVRAGCFCQHAAVDIWQLSASLCQRPVLLLLRFPRQHGLVTRSQRRWSYHPVLRRMRQSQLPLFRRPPEVTRTLPRHQLRWLIRWFPPDARLLRWRLQFYTCEWTVGLFSQRVFWNHQQLHCYYPHWCGHVTRVFSGIYGSICLLTFLIRYLKNRCSYEQYTKLDIAIFHHESCKPILGVKRSKVKVMRHKNIAGVGQGHSCECWLFSSWLSEINTFL